MEPEHDGDHRHGAVARARVRGRPRSVPLVHRSRRRRRRRSPLPQHLRHDENFDVFGDSSYMLVYDIATDELVDTIAVPCPMMDVATLGDDGYLYVSGWSYMPLSYEAGYSDTNCAARIDVATRTLDPAWTFDYAAATGGDQGSGLRAIAGDDGIFAAFHGTGVEVGPGDGHLGARRRRRRLGALRRRTRSEGRDADRDPDERRQLLREPRRRSLLRLPAGQGSDDRSTSARRAGSSRASRPGAGCRACSRWVGARNDCAPRWPRAPAKAGTTPRSWTGRIRSSH